MAKLKLRNLEVKNGMSLYITLGMAIQVSYGI